MANRVNNWEQLLELANKDLKKYGVEINVLFVDDTGDYDLHIFYPDGTTDIFAQNYYEDELGELVNDAWAHARAKAKVNSKKTLYLAFPICDEFQRHDLDRKTDDELFDTMRYSQGIVDDVLCYDDVKVLFKDMNDEEIESTAFWFYKIEIDKQKFIDWSNN